MSLSRSLRVGMGLLVVLGISGYAIRYTIATDRFSSTEAEGFLGLVHSRIADDALVRLVQMVRTTDTIAIEGKSSYTATLAPGLLIGAAGSGFHTLVSSGTLDHMRVLSTTDTMTEGSVDATTTRSALSGETVGYSLGVNTLLHVLGLSGDSYVQRETLTIEETPDSVELIALRASYLREYQNTRFHMNNEIPAAQRLRGSLDAINMLAKRRVVENSDNTISFLASGGSMHLSGQYDPETKALFFVLEDSHNDLMVTVSETHLDDTYDITVARKTTGTAIFNGLLRIKAKRKNIDVTFEGKLHTRFTESLQIMQSLTLRPVSVPTVTAPPLFLEWNVVFGGEEIIEPGL